MRIYLYYDVEHPYRVIPMFLVMEEVWPRGSWEHLIVDSGVNRFFKRLRLKEYPRWYLEAYGWHAERLYRLYGDRVWVVAPDYPDDYEGNRMPRNTERTLRNVEWFLSSFEANWLVVVQARYLDLAAYREALRTYRRLVGDYPRIGIGTLCTRAPREYARRVAMATRRFFPESWIHVFGPSLRILKAITPYVDSIDTTAYYRVPRNLRGRGPVSRQQAAMEWLKAARKAVKNKPAPLEKWLHTP